MTASRLCVFVLATCDGEMDLRYLRFLLAMVRSGFALGYAVTSGICVHLCDLWVHRQCLSLIHI